MINAAKSIVLDIDGTLCPIKTEAETYAGLKPYADVIDLLREYKARGFYIILHTSRNMRSYGGNIGRINANTLKVLLQWLEDHDIPHDEVHVAKPWPGAGGFIVDDKAIRPSEFRSLDYDQITALLAREVRTET